MRSRLCPLAENEIATKSLRVCWEAPLSGKNCGRCEKCAKTHLAFIAVGHPNPSCFDDPLDLSFIERIAPMNENRLRGYRYLLEVSRDRSDEPWRKALDKRLRVLHRKSRLGSLREVLRDVVGAGGNARAE